VYNPHPDVVEALIKGGLDIESKISAGDTTNAIESLNRVIRKSIKTRGSFPTEDAALKLIYLAIRKFEKGGRNLHEWYAARNQLAIMFYDRFNA
jgi:transposase-like protein